jgi:hypothetical protein
MWTVSRDAVVDFFAGGRDHRGRSIDGILTWGDELVD